MNYTVLFGIFNTLLMKKQVSSTYLANKYKVCRRTIYRYIDILTISNIPICTKAGCRGGISIPETFKLPTGLLNSKELEATLNALDIVNKDLPSEEITSAIEKISCAYKNLNAKSEYFSGNIIIDSGSWSENYAYRNKLLILQDSIKCRKVLEIEYHDRNGEVSNRKINTHLLVFKQGIWYAYAFCEKRQDFRFFKIARIKYAKFTDEIFERKNLENYVISFNKWYEEDKKSIEIEFEIDKNILSDVEEWLGIDNILAINNKFYSQIKLPFDNNLISKILSFGNGLKVVSPKNVIDDIKLKLNEISALYK